MPSQIVEEGNGVAIRDLRRILREEDAADRGHLPPRRVIPSVSQGSDGVSDYVHGARAVAVDQMEGCFRGFDAYELVGALETATVMQAFLGVRDQRDAARKMNVELTTREQSLMSDFAKTAIDEYRTVFLEMDNIAKVFMRMGLLLEMTRDQDDDQLRGFLSALTREVESGKGVFSAVLNAYQNGMTHMRVVAGNE